MLLQAILLSINLDLDFHTESSIIYSLFAHIYRTQHRAEQILPLPIRIPLALRKCHCNPSAVYPISCQAVNINIVSKSKSFWEKNITILWRCHVLRLQQSYVGWCLDDFYYTQLSNIRNVKWFYLNTRERDFYLIFLIHYKSMRHNDWPKMDVVITKVNYLFLSIWNAYLLYQFVNLFLKVILNNCKVISAVDCMPHWPLFVC